MDVVTVADVIDDAIVAVVPSDDVVDASADEGIDLVADTAGKDIGALEVMGAAADDDTTEEFGLVVAVSAVEVAGGIVLGLDVAGVWNQDLR